MQLVLTPDKLCAMARSREKLNTYIGWSLVAAAIILAGAFLYNVYRIDQPWIRLGQAWTLGVIIYLFGPGLELGRGRKGASDSCARFLERQHEERRCGYLRIRGRLFLFIPGMAACWLGRGPLGLFIITGIALVLMFFAFGQAATKAARDRDEVLRY